MSEGRVDKLERVVEGLVQHEGRIMRALEQIDMIHGQVHNLANLSELPRIGRSIEHLTTTIGRTMLSLIVILGIVLVLMVWRDANKDLSVGSGGITIGRGE